MSYYIAHSGTKGMKWGVRKYQNEDGTLTAAGKERYRNMMPTSARASQQKAAQNNKNPNRKSGQTEYDRLAFSVGLNGSGANNDYILDRAINTAQENFKKDTNGMSREEMVDYIDHKYANDKTDYGQNIADQLRQTRHAMLQVYDSDKQQRQQAFDKSMKDQKSKGFVSGMPTSAITAKKKAEYESLVKSKIPASAWNQRVKRP